MLLKNLQTILKKNYFLIKGYIKKHKSNLDLRILKTSTLICNSKNLHKNKNI